MKQDTLARIGVLIAIVIAIVPAVYAFVPSFGGITNHDEVDATALKVGGTNGSRLDLIGVGTCSLISPNFTVTASSTAAMDCAISGVTSGDTVSMWFATSTALFGGWSINGSSASTTAGFVTVTVYNGTGANAVVPSGLASSTNYAVFSTRSTVPGL